MEREFPTHHAEAEKNCAPPAPAGLASPHLRGTIREAQGRFMLARTGELGRMKPYPSFLVFHSHSVLFSLVC